MENILLNVHHLIILCQISNKQLRFQAKENKNTQATYTTYYTICAPYESDTIYNYVTYFEKKFIFLNTKQAKQKRKDKTKIFKPKKIKMEALAHVA